MFPGELPLTEEATARLTALSEFQDLGSGMRIAMRDLEIRGVGSGSGVGRGINADVANGGMGPVQAALAILAQLGPSGDDD